MKEEKVIEISHKKLAIGSLVILVPLQILVIGIWPLVVLWIGWYWRNDNWKMGGRRLKWRLIVSLIWPGLIFWDFFTSKGYLNKIVVRARF